MTLFLYGSSLVLAALIGAGILIWSRARRVARPDGDSIARYLPEHRALAIAAIALIVLVGAEMAVDGYALNLDGVVAWWRYATPILGALAGITVVLAMIATRGTRRPEVPTPPTERRTGLSFTSHAGLIGAGVALAALVVTTVMAGLASSPDGQGRYVWLVVPIPNEPQVDPIRVWTYGWTYGVPVLICLGGLVAVTWAALRSNAARPFARPETVGAERAARTEVGSGLLGIATGGMLLTLSGALHFLGAGAVARLVIEDESGARSTYTAPWAYAGLIGASAWLSPVVEVTALVVLLLVATRLYRGKSAVSRESAVPVGAEAVR